MRLRLLLPALFVFGGVLAFGSAPVGRVISTEPVDIDGITVPATNFVPVGLGGEVTTKAKSALIQFSDGGSVVVQPNSQVKIVGKVGDLQVSVVRGAAQYKMASGSAVRGANLTSQTATKGSENNNVAEASVVGAAGIPFVIPETSSTRVGGTVSPSMPAPSNGFTMGTISQGTFVSNAGGGGTSLQIVTPGGLTINLTPVTSPTGVVTYTVASISQTVIQPNGVVAVVQVTSGPLIGATVPAITPTTNTGTTVDVSFVPAGSSTPLTPSQATQSVQTSVTTAINTAVANGQVQAGTTAPSPSPVSTGTFSSTAP